MVIGIIGCGIVGGAIRHVFQKNTEILICDPKIEDSVSLGEMYARCSLIFVCVPTPMRLSDQQLDATFLDETICSLAALYIEARFSNPVVCIKSTVTPDKLREYTDLTPLRLTMSPEFLTEANYLEDAVNMKLLVVGGDPIDCKVVTKAFSSRSICALNYKVRIVDIVTAGMLKYMQNCFLALKVTFMNQMFSIFEKSESKDPWDYLIECFHIDPRFGCSHGKVPGQDGDFGWGGKCFPKDVNAMICYAESLGVDLDIMKQSWLINQRTRNNKDWLLIEGATSNTGVEDESAH